MSTQSTIKQMFIQVGVSVLAGGMCLAWLVVFAESFKDGATWSGLNPNGGGPGFLLLITSGSLSLFMRSRWARTATAIQSIIFAACVSPFCGLVLWLGIPIGGDLPSGAMTPLISGTVGAFFVPRVVAAVLNEAWTQAETASKIPS